MNKFWQVILIKWERALFNIIETTEQNIFMTHTPTLNDFYWGHQSSWALTPATIM